MVLFTDNSADLSKDYLERNGISCLCLSFVVDNKPYPSLEAYGFTSQDYYRYLRNGGVATTSQINESEYLEAFRPVLAKGEDILYMGLSGGLSGCLEGAQKAAILLKKEFPQRDVFVCDTRMASMGVGLLVKHAVMLRDKGASCSEIYKWLTDNRMNFNALFTVDDLNFLRRGGRLKSSVAFIGSLLKIKPVLNVDENGHLIARENVRGRKAALNTLVERMKQLVTTFDQPMLISHGDSREDAEYVANQLRALGVKDIELGDIGPVIGTHSGPGTIALFFLGKGSTYPQK